MIEKIKEHIKKNFSFVDEEMQETLINTAISSLKNELSRLTKALDSNDKEEIIKIAHKIKGILLNAGLEDLSKEFDENLLRGLEIEKIKNKLYFVLKKIEI